MKADLDRLMAERALDVLIIIKRGSTEVMSMKYVTGGVSLGEAFYIKKRNAAPLLISSEFEREEAAKSGIEVKILADFGYKQLLAEHKNVIAAQAALWDRIFDTFGLRGRVGFYGLANPGVIFHVLTRLVRARPDLELVGEGGTDIFTAAARTKSADEIAHLRDAAQRTCDVMTQTRDYIVSHVVREETLIKPNGTPLTIGDVKRFVRARLLDNNLEDTEGMIFAQGRDGGIPHSKGTEDAALVLGKPIVFDLYPRSIETGYFHDMTRTWCLGHAPADVQAAYAQVMEVFDCVTAALKVGEKCRQYQDMACEIFECYGHKTLRSKERSLEGYVHSLGHGIGLNIHEAPRFSQFAPNDVIDVGNAFTVEPGLYYPDSAGKGWGVRVEDSFYVSESGAIVSMSTVPKDLVIRM